MMIIWDTKTLAKKFVEGNLDEWEKSKYYLVELVIQFVAVGIPGYLVGIKLDSLGLLSYVFSIVVAYVYKDFCGVSIQKGILD